MSMLKHNYTIYNSNIIQIIILVLTKSTKCKHKHFVGTIFFTSQMRGESQSDEHQVFP